MSGAGISRVWPFLSFCRPLIAAMILLLGVAPTLLGTSALAEKQSTGPAIAFAARIVGDGKRARIIVDFDRKVSHSAYLLDHPKRVIIDLSETVFSLDGEAKHLPKTLVTDLRYGTIAPGQSRIVLELAQSVSIESHRLKKTENDNRHRMIIDLVAAKESAFAAAVRKAPKPARPAKPKSGKDQVLKRFKIVIDPGHGGIDGGATGADRTREKTVTLGFALKLRDMLEQNPAFSVILTRDDDRFVALQDRVSVARNNKADLLISVHADSLRQKSIRGATVYTLSEEGSDTLSRILARKQNRADLIAGLSLPESKPDIADILIDLTRRETEAFSVRFARLVIKRMKNDVKLIRNPHRSADFFVLKAPEIPSVLLELGYLSNSEDEALMRAVDWQNKAAARVAEAILAFFQPRM